MLSAINRNTVRLQSESVAAFVGIRMFSDIELMNADIRAKRCQVIDGAKVARRRMNRPVVTGILTGEFEAEAAICA